MLGEWPFDTARVKLAGWMAPFSGAFTVPTWQRVLVLLVGSILSPGAGPWPRRCGSLAWIKILTSPISIASSTAAAGQAAAWRAAYSVCWSTRLSRTGPSSSVWTTRWNGGGERRLQHAASRVIRSARRTATSSRRAACVGFRS